MIPDNIQKMLKCNHEVENIFFDYITYETDFNINKQITVKTVKMLCSKCNQLISVEYVTEVKGKAMLI